MPLVQLAPLTAVDSVFSRALGGDIEWTAVAKAICPALSQEHLAGVLDELAKAQKAIPRDAKATRSKTLGIADAYRAVETVLRADGYEVKSPIPLPPAPVLPPIASRREAPPQARTVRDEMQAQDPMSLLPEDERRLLEEHRARRALQNHDAKLAAEEEQIGKLREAAKSEEAATKAFNAGLMGAKPPEAVAQILGQDASAPARTAGADEERREHGQPPTVPQGKKPKS